MEEENSRDIGKAPGNNKKPESSIFLWKWQVLLPLVCGLIGIVFGSYITWRIFRAKLDRAKIEFEYSTEPKCDLTFVSGSTIRSTSPYFLFKNQGPGILADYWFKETIFLLDTVGVHECIDLPHFEYLLYCGSSTSMGSLFVNAEKRIDIDPCWKKVFEIFFKKFKGKLISRFRLTGSALASPEFLKDFYFIIEYEKFAFLKYITPEEYTGGKELVDSVIAYTQHGPKSIIEYCFNEFFKNPPESFYPTEDGRYIPIREKPPPGTPCVLRPIYSESVGSGCTRMVWRCDDVICKCFRDTNCEPGVGCQQ